MTPNVGTIDRVVRIVLGLALIGWGVYAQAWWGAIGVVPLSTAVVSWCPIYIPFGFNSK